MLSIKTNDKELWDEVNLVFIQLEGRVLRFEHSLASLSKWESIHKVPFLDGKTRTPEQILSYVHCMCLDEDATELDMMALDRDQLQEVITYIEVPQTATTFGRDNNRGGRRETITSELIYYWMGVYHIPFEAQTWHLSRLLTLIRIHNVKSGPTKKMPKSELAAQMRTLNEQRRREMGTTG
jgi:hypothetical protein